MLFRKAVLMIMVWTNKQLEIYDNAVVYFKENKSKNIDEDNKYVLLNHIFNLNIIYNEAMSPAFSSIYNDMNFNDLRWNILDYFIKTLNVSYIASLRQRKIESVLDD